MSKKELTIGSDPEFLIYNHDTEEEEDKFSLMPAELWFGHERSCNTHIGTDGHGPIGEIRPPHDKTPEGHFAKTKNLIEQLPRVFQGGIIVAGTGMGEKPIGGHLHFGSTDKNLRRDLAHKPSEWVSALDWGLAIPLLMIEDKLGARKRRLYKRYGFLSEAREQNWGFEYRTPSSWLVSASITKAVLCLSYTIMDAAVNNQLPRGLNTKIGQIFYKNIGREEAVKNKFMVCDKEFFKPLIPKIYKAVKRLPLYKKKYYHIIASLFSLIKLGKDWQEDRPILPRWGIDTDEKSNVQRRGYIKVSDDLYCKEICAGISMKTHHFIYIYGIREKGEKGERREDVVVNAVDRHEKETIRQVMRLECPRDVCWSMTHLGSSADNFLYGHINAVTIGFTLEMRKKRPELCKHLIEETIKAVSEGKFP